MLTTPAMQINTIRPAHNATVLVSERRAPQCLGSCVDVSVAFRTSFKLPLRAIAQIVGSGVAVSLARDALHTASIIGRIDLKD
jgi:hypothetical protein